MKHTTFIIKNLTITAISYFTLIESIKNLTNIYMLLTCIIAFMLFIHGMRGLLSAYLKSIGRTDLDERIKL